MHEELDVMPSSTSYKKVVKYLCDSNEVFVMLFFFLVFFLVLSLMIIPSVL